ncbi:ABC transporter permease [Cryobacterium zhongshanensis]|uniref:ABC transporter permease n=1 Tax=Cryobacterium zhongshanensis TaxID=2928153 RepID=A0AA41UIY8_9MICO|nr:ABC transporter permease [Cryobacterium zhongshanensis]MCI4660069.1 ABC transporter permease [Cryobacterium zhongshanensis]
MGQYLTVVRYEIIGASRDRLPRTLLIVFLGMIAASGIIGWLTNQTVTAVYNQIRADGLTGAPNPFMGVSPLRYMSNTVIYVVLIGALLSTVAGVQTALRDRKMNTTDLVLSRPVSPVRYVAGKLTGQALWLAVVLAIAAFTNWVSISVITGTVLSLSDAGQIALFYAMSWMFLLFFVSLGMISGLRSGSEAIALLVPVLVWGILIFVVPQLGTAAHPVSLLNPVAVPPSQGGFFQLMNTVLGPFALGEHFKNVSSSVLATSVDAQTPVLSFLVVALFTAVAVTSLLLTPRTVLRKALHE